jgi:hypothetical protein
MRPLRIALSSLIPVRYEAAFTVIVRGKCFFVQAKGKPSEDHRTVLDVEYQLDAQEGSKVGCNRSLNFASFDSIFIGLNPRFKRRPLTLFRSTFLPFLFDFG